MSISDISIILVLIGISVVLTICGVLVKIKGAIDLLSDSLLVVTACVAVAGTGSVALNILVESPLISFIFVEVSELPVDENNEEIPTEEEKLTLDFVVLGAGTVLLSDVIAVDCEEIADDKVIVGSVVLDRPCGNSVFPTVVVSCNSEASVVSMSTALGTGNEVTTSSITAKVVLEVMWETAGV